MRVVWYKFRGGNLAGFFFQLGSRMVLHVDRTSNMCMTSLYLVVRLMTVSHSSLVTQNASG